MKDAADRLKLLIVYDDETGYEFGVFNDPEDRDFADECLRDSKEDYPNADVKMKERTI